MAFESDARRQAGLLADAAGRAQREGAKVKSVVDGSNQWWKGKASEAFHSEYRDVDSDMGRLRRSVDSAVNNLNRLPSLIERAERERREEAARKAAALKK